MESLLRNQGLNLQPPALQGEVLTARPAGKSRFHLNCLMCGFDYRDWLIIRNTRFVSIPWCPASRGHSLNTWVTGTGSSSQRPASGHSHSGAHTLRHQLHCSTGSRVLPRHLPTALIFTTACTALWPSLASPLPTPGWSQDGLQGSKSIRLFLLPPQLSAPSLLYQQCH